MGCTCFWEPVCKPAHHMCSVHGQLWCSFKNPASLFSASSAQITNSDHLSSPAVEAARPSLSWNPCLSPVTDSTTPRGHTALLQNMEFSFPKSPYGSQRRGSQGEARNETAGEPAPARGGHSDFCPQTELHGLHDPQPGKVKTLHCKLFPTESPRVS